MCQQEVGKRDLKCKLIRTIVFQAFYFSFIFSCSHLGTNKIQQHCSFRMKVRPNANGSIMIDVCYTHYLGTRTYAVDKRESIAATIQ